MIRFPHDVDGWLTEGEGRALAEVAAGKRVLEIGSYLGRSTICLAQTATHVTSIDPHDGRGTSTPQLTFEGLRANLGRYQVLDKCTCKVGTSEEVAYQLLALAYDLVFIDGGHDWQDVQKDVNLAIRLLVPGGLIAFHDYQNGTDPGVDKVAWELQGQGARMVKRAGSVAVFQLPDRTISTVKADARLIGLMMPRSGAACRNFDAGTAFLQASTKRLDIIRTSECTSLAIRCFNRLLCNILNCRRNNPGLTHIAMQHDDICPEPGWLDVLVAEQDATGADMVSAVVPIKNGCGATSTGIDMEAAPWITRRLTMHEIFELPETFGIEHVPWRLPESQMVVNSGLWVLKLGQWFDDIFPLDNPTGETRVAGLAFQDEARIIQGPDGLYSAEDISEDWHWSRQLLDLGLELVATRKTGLYHERHEFHNRAPWGAWRTDESHAKYLAGMRGQLATA